MGVFGNYHHFYKCQVSDYFVNNHSETYTHNYTGDDHSGVHV